MRDLHKFIRALRTSTSSSGRGKKVMRLGKRYYLYADFVDGRSFGGRNYWNALGVGKGNCLSLQIFTSSHVGIFSLYTYVASTWKYVLRIRKSRGNGRRRRPLQNCTHTLNAM